MAQIDTTITIEEDGVLIIENDVRVTASICGDGEVLIDTIELIKWGATVEISKGVFHRPVDKLIPFSESDKPYLVALADAGAELLLDDDKFISEARERYAMAVKEHADGLGDYLYEQARDRKMEATR